MLFSSRVGIAVTDHSVHVIYLKGSFRGMTPSAAATLDLAPERSRQDREADTAAFINGFLRDQKALAADVFMAVPGNRVMLREIAFPLAVKENLRATLTYELEKYLPVAADDVYFDYQILSEDKENGKINILLAAVKRQDLDPYLGLAEKIDRGVSGIGIGPAALAAYFFHHQGEPAEGLLILYHAAGTDGEAAILKDRSMVYAASLGIPDGPDFKARLLRLRDAFRAENHPVRLFVYGADVAADPFAGLRGEFAEISAGVLHGDRESAAYVPALGAALCGSSKAAVDINLMPPRLRKKPDRTGVYVMAALLVLVAVTAMLWAAGHIITQRRLLQDLDAELARLRTEVSKIEAIQSETRAMEKNMADLLSLRPGKIFALEILTELSAVIPPDAYLTDLKLTGDKVQIYGVAASATELIGLLENSPLFKNVEFISTIRKDRDGREIFRIGCTLDSGEKEG